MVLGLFKSLSNEEVLKMSKKDLEAAKRSMDREKTRLEREEQKLILDIKKEAKNGGTVSKSKVKIMAKDLVRIRKNLEKFTLMRTQIQGVISNTQCLKAQHAVANNMRNVTPAMQNMNKQMNLPQMQQTLREFGKQSDLMDMKEELMNEAIDNAVGNDDDEEESDQIVSQVLDEMGLQLSGQLSGLKPASTSLSVSNKTTVSPAAGASSVSESNADTDLLTRLNNLRSG